MGKLLKEYDPGDQVDSVCVLGSLSVRQTKAQKPFLRLELNDSSGRIDAVMWDGFDEEMTRTPPGVVLQVQGRLEEYNDKAQVVVNRITIPPPGSFDPSDLMPSSERDNNKMIAELDKLVSGVNNPLIRKLLETAFGDEPFRTAFSQAPAAKRWHQPYIGGLLEHTLNVVSHARALAARYPEVEPDIVLAGALLHDIGKTVEYTWDGYLDNSTQGKLVGHLVIGVEMLGGWIAQVGKFPEQLGWHIKHIILSHHGRLEYGSPLPPRTLEALVVHFADDLDSKMGGVMKVRNQQLDSPGEWTDYIRLMETEFFKAPVLETSPAAEGKPSSPAAKPNKSGRDNDSGENQSLF